MTLDWESARFRALLRDAGDWVADLYDSLPGRKVYNAIPPEELRARFYSPLPESGTAPEDLLRSKLPELLRAATLNISPNFFGYVMSGGSQMGIIAELVSAALNQNHTKWHLSAGAAEIERTAVGWISEFIRYRSGAGGVLVSGGSEANLVCLTVARKKKAGWDVAAEGLAGHPQLTIYASAETHSCTDKSVDSLGIGKNHLRKIQVNENFQIDLGKLEERLKDDLNRGYRPFCVVGNGGTVNTGAIDPLDALADLAAKYDLWLHVDGAYGSPAAGTRLAPEEFRGLARADSVAVDAHKWLQVPFEAGCALIRSWGDLRETYTVVPDYLKAGTDSGERLDFLQHGFQLSRNFKALKVWLQFLAYGAEKLRKVIENDMELMRALGSLIENSPDFELMAPVPLSVVCFRYAPDESPALSGEELDELNAAIVNKMESDGRYFLTSTKIRGRFAIRACCINHRAESGQAGELLEYVRAVSEETLAAMKPARRIQRA